MILIIYAHPYPQHSHANKRMLEQAGTLEGVEIRSLYQLYPDFNIDVAAEQAALVPIWLSGSTRCSGIACRRC
jgi:glutathione-regulated potassium-efflux system ancillary protein KefF